MHEVTALDEESQVLRDAIGAMCGIAFHVLLHVVYRG